MSSHRHWFISDTHFCDARPEHLQAFDRLLSKPRPGDTVLLLGDIFEIWVTDDLANSSDLHIEALIRKCVERGVNVYFMPGNRDFMVGKAFIERTGCTYLADPSTWLLPDGRSCVLTHGDWFCTNDPGYRRYRQIIRNKAFQFCFRHLPKKFRLSIAAKIRASSLEHHKQNGNRSYDANAELIDSYFDRYAPINIIVMGHTHLPNLHQSDNRNRLVLGDWRQTLWYATADRESGLTLFESDLMLSEPSVRHQF